jgi:hypothetical protein
MVLDKMQGYLHSEDVHSYRSFAQRWVAMRMSDGFAPENLIHSVVSIGDVVDQVARERLGATQESHLFVRSVQRLSYVAARLLVEILADELERRRDHRRRLGGGA